MDIHADMQHEHGQGHGHAAQTRTCSMASMDIDMDMQHGHGHLGHLAWTFSCSMDLDNRHTWMPECRNADKKLSPALLVFH
jgi:hypothetical protein